MLSIVVTWIGAVFGIVVLLTMAFGAFAIDLDDALGRRTTQPPPRHGDRAATPSR